MLEKPLTNDEIIERKPFKEMNESRRIYYESEDSGKELIRMVE